MGIAIYVRPMTVMNGITSVCVCVELAEKKFDVQYSKVVALTRISN